MLVRLVFQLSSIHPMTRQNRGACHLPGSAIAMKRLTQWRIYGISPDNSGHRTLYRINPDNPPKS